VPAATPHGVGQPFFEPKRQLVAPDPYAVALLEQRHDPHQLGTKAVIQSLPPKAPAAQAREDTRLHSATDPCHPPPPRTVGGRKRCWEVSWLTP